ncbi:MAG TPA: hydantoinase/oxoprolinase family protein [Acidimicrobiales bacterium]|nr:hydantoinase/oxoprolinase family protein [Acidimicrobiales bacterium]
MDVLAADIGGTFTDVVLATDDGDIVVSKLLSTPADPTDAVIAGVTDVLARAPSVQPTRIDRVVHGTTLATNLVLERRGAPIAFIGTEGFRWMLWLGRQARVEEERYDLFFDPAPPPVPLDRTFEVRERVGPAGEVIIPLDEEGARTVAAEVRRLGVAGVAICLLHAYANPVHEQRLAEICRNALSTGTVVACSSEVLPEVREYERATTTVVSASVGPVMSAYLDRLGSRLRAIGVTAPVHVMECSGGVMPAALAAARAVYTIESGPAAGVIAAAQVGQRLGVGDVISFDMGGTTAKAGVVRGGEADITYQFHVGGKGSFGGRRAGTGTPVRIPAIDLAEVGAGGGSIAWLDAAGALRVGPRSAGAQPGPACYGRGGTDATVTDADLVLGYLATSGALPLDTALAETALEHAIGVDALAAASAVHDIVNAAMATAIHTVTVARGIDPRHFALVCLGGAAPAHAARVAEQFGIVTVLVPPRAGVGSAVGLLSADLRTDRAATRLVRADLADPDELEALLAGLAMEAARAIGDGADIDRSVDARYAGQGHEVTIALPAGRLDPRAVAEALYERYRGEYGIDLRDPVELVTFRARATRRVPRPQPRAGRGAARYDRHRTAYFGAPVETPVVAREACAPGERFDGPVLLEEPESTLVVPPGWWAQVLGDGTVRMQPSAAAEAAQKAQKAQKAGTGA